MSVKCMDRVWEHSRAKGSALLLLLAIADHAHDDGTGAYMSQRTLAAKTRLSVRQVRRLIDQLVAARELSSEAREGTTDMLAVLVGTAPGQDDRPSHASVTDAIRIMSGHPGHSLVRPGRTSATATPDMATSAEPSRTVPRTVPRTVSSEEAAAAPRPDGLHRLRVAS
jgi:hypothetical protein